MTNKTLQAAAVALNANKLISTEPTNLPTEAVIACNNVFGANATYYISNIHVEQIDLTATAKIKVTDEQGRPLGNAIINVTTTIMTIPFLTNNEGETLVQVSGQLLNATATRNGYEKKEIKIANETITLKREFFIINSPATRY